MNRLADQRSPYLRHAAHQKIDWYPWCDEAFDRAKKEDKPVFLSSGAIWCHWCHVMAEESFEDEEVAQLLNSHFISIKLDRDERPDIDRRYQRAVAAMGGGSGWPLSVFLTHDRKPFYGGTYFPLHEGFGRPGFKTLLKAISELYRVKKDEVIENSKEIVDFLKPQTPVKGQINLEMVDMGLKAILDSADRKNGGFGYAPKFPMSGAIDFLLNRYFFTGDGELGVFLKKTLSSMAKGGIYDQLAGGFHRYSTDAGWNVPHFEKMLDDNVWLLKNYIDAYNIFHDRTFMDIALGIIGFIRDELSDRDGGFYASQDADVTPDDEGGYFTWSREEIKDVLTGDEFNVISAYYLHDTGRLHHNPEKMTLSVSEDMDKLAEKIGIDSKVALSIIEKGKGKLLAARKSRQKPFIDKTIYTSLNGMGASIFLKAHHTLKDEYIKGFALKTLQRVMKENMDEGGLLHSTGVRAMLDDYIYLADGLISAHEATGDNGYLRDAEKIIKMCIDRLWDHENGGFFDSEDDVMGIRLKGIDDAPYPSANSLAIIVLLRLWAITRDEKYRLLAEETIRAFSSQAESMGIHGGYFFCALDAYFHMLELTVQRGASSELIAKALSIFYPYKVIRYEDGGEGVIPCMGGVCYEPIKDPEMIEGLIRKV